MTTDSIITDILRREGWPKYTNHPADRGGPTKGGITLLTLEVHRNRRCTVDDLKNLTEEEARKIYYVKFCRRWEKIADEPLRIFLIDYSVNSGEDDAVMALQTGLKSIGAYPNRIDGSWGPGTEAGVRTLNALSISNNSRVYKEVYKHRQNLFLRLALRDGLMVKFMRENPGAQVHNLQGWMNRLVEFL